jgi:hypothetical protein
VIVDSYKKSHLVSEVAAQSLLFITHLVATLYSLLFRACTTRFSFLGTFYGFTKAIYKAHRGYPAIPALCKGGLGTLKVDATIGWHGI